jgi:hypothetical protein
MLSIYATDTVTERGLRWVKIIESLNSDLSLFLASGVRRCLLQISSKVE